MEGRRRPVLGAAAGAKQPRMPLSWGANVYKAWKLGRSFRSAVDAGFQNGAWGPDQQEFRERKAAALARAS